MLKTRAKVVVGQTLYMYDTRGNYGFSRATLRPVTVAKVGKKYFELDPSYYNKFTIDDWSEYTNYCQKYYLFESQQEFDDMMEADELTGELCRFFTSIGRASLPLNKLRRIKEIVEE